VYNYIKEEVDPLTQEAIPRKYFSGGLMLGGALNAAMSTIHTISSNSLTKDRLERISLMFNPLASQNRAMIVNTVNFDNGLSYQESYDYQGFLQNVHMTTELGALELRRVTNRFYNVFEAYLDGRKISADMTAPISFTIKNKVLHLAKLYLKEQGQGLGRLILDWIVSYVYRQQRVSQYQSETDNPDMLWIDYQFLQNESVTMKAEIISADGVFREDNIEVSRNNLLGMLQHLDVLALDGQNILGKLNFSETGQLNSFDLKGNNFATREIERKNDLNRTYEVVGTRYRVEVIDGIKVRFFDGEQRKYATRLHGAQISISGTLKASKRPIKRPNLNVADLDPRFDANLWDWEQARVIIHEENTRNGVPSDEPYYFSNSVDVRERFLELLEKMLKGNITEEEFIEKMKEFNRFQLLGKNGDHYYKSPRMLDRNAKERAGKFMDDTESEAKLRNIFRVLQQFCQLDSKEGNGKTLKDIVRLVTSFYVQFMTGQIEANYIFRSANHSLVMNMVNGMLRLYGLQGIRHDALDHKLKNFEGNYNIEPFYTVILDMVKDANPGVDFNENARRHLERHDAAMKVESLSLDQANHIVGQMVDGNGRPLFILNEDGSIQRNPKATPLTLDDIKLLLVRHGETMANLFWELQGGGADDHLLNSLDNAGRMQVRELAEHLMEQKEIRNAARHGKLVVMTSGMLRTRQTAAPFLKLLGGLQSIDDRNIAEINNGNLENQIATNLPESEEYSREIRDRHNTLIKIDSGECYLEFLFRIYRWFRELNNGKFKGKTVLVFSHGATMRALGILTGNPVFQDPNTHVIDWFKGRVENGKILRLDEPLLPAWLYSNAASNPDQVISVLKDLEIGVSSLKELSRYGNIAASIKILGSFREEMVHYYAIHDTSQLLKNIDKFLEILNEMSRMLSNQTEYSGLLEQIHYMESQLSYLGGIVTRDKAQLVEKNRASNNTLARMSGIRKDGGNSVQAPGGIDLTPANMNLQTHHKGGEIKFYLDPKLLEQLRNVPGFVPVIINIQPMTNLRQFLDVPESPAATSAPA